jgi:hypothetical protein
MTEEQINAIEIGDPLPKPDDSVPSSSLLSSPKAYRMNGLLGMLEIIVLYDDQKWRFSVPHSAKSTTPIKRTLESAAALTEQSYPSREVVLAAIKQYVRAYLGG